MGRPDLNAAQAKADTFTSSHPVCVLLEMELDICNSSCVLHANHNAALYKVNLSLYCHNTSPAH